jgi:hypothetical protein
MKGKNQVCADESKSKKAKNCEQAPPLPDVMFHDVPPEQVPLSRIRRLGIYQ